VAAGKGICLVPESVARDYPRADVSYVEVTDADPAVTSLAWPPAGVRPIVQAFIETAKRGAAEPLARV